LITFRNNNKDESAKIAPETGVNERINIIRRSLAEVFGSPQVREAKCNTVDQLQLVNAMRPLENLK
jgi:hypothetical protein